jgi:hypothetical protein
MKSRGSGKLVGKSVTLGIKERRGGSKRTVFPASLDSKKPNKKNVPLLLKNVPLLD